MLQRLRWQTVLIPTLVVGVIAFLDDAVVDAYLPFPWDAIAIVVVVFVFLAAFLRAAFRRIDSLAGALAARNDELERRNTTARALHRISVAVAAVSDLDEVLRAVVDEARTILSADVAMLLLTGGAGELELQASSGPSSAIRPAGDAPGRDATRFLDPLHATAQLAAPLQRGGQTIGLLAVASRVQRSFDVGDVEALASLANQAAIALENARLQARLRELAVVAERERIAHEMHDGLAQVLGYVNTKSQAVERLLEGGQTAEARAQLEQLATAARSIYVDVREAILGLRSPITPGLGLVVAIESYAGRFADASKLAVSVKAPGDARAIQLSPEVAAQVFRVVQESLTNVRKHAGARRVEVTVEATEETLVVTLADDGRGFGPAIREAADWPHYGLQAMRERAAAIGGSITWTNDDDSGAVVRLEVPLGSSARRLAGSTSTVAPTSASTPTVAG